VEPTTTQPALTSAYYFSVLRRRRRIVIAGALIGLVLGALYTFSRPSGYTSSASVEIQQVTTDPFSGDIERGISAETEQNVMASTVVAERASEILGRDTDPDDLLKRLTVENPVDTLVLTNTFRASTPERARQGAQAFADAYLEYRQGQYEGQKERYLATINAELESLGANLTVAQQQVAAAAPNSQAFFAAQGQVDQLRTRIIDTEASRSTIQAVDTNAGEVIKPARLPTGTSGLPRMLTVLAFAVLGTVGGLVAALVRQRTDAYLRTREDFVEAFGRPPLAEVGRGEARLGHRRSSLELARGTPDASAFRHLRVRLWPTRPPKYRRVLLADVEDEATTARLVHGIASSLAAAQWRVLVIWPERPGPDFDRYAFSGVEGVRLLSWNDIEGYSGDAIDPTTFLRVLEDATVMDEIVLVTAPPIQSVAEGPELYSILDGVLVSFDPSETKRATLEDALDEVTRMGGEVAGIVVSPVPGRW
jgi:capsular polysaccharide biosynthesis protein